MSASVPMSLLKLISLVLYSLKTITIGAIALTVSKTNERLEDTLNEHARNGWRVIHIGEQNTRIVFERDKNR